MKIELTPAEILQGVIVGARRYVDSITHNRQDASGFSNGWENEIEGALAELAVAKHLGLYYDPNLGKFGQADVGEYHVRQTKYPDGRLRIAPREKEGKYLLVTGELGRYVIRGWYWANEVIDDWYCSLQPGRPKQFWVPQNELKPL